MKSLFILAAACLGIATAASAAPDGKPIYQNDFEAEKVESLPSGLMVIAGAFQVVQQDGNKVLELPGEPLDTFGLLFGPAGEGDLSASLRAFGTKQGRKFPGFGISLGGVGGYRLVVSAGKKALEIFKGDEVQQSVPFEWASGAWTSLRLQVRKEKGAWVVEGKAWSSAAPEPAAWMISLPGQPEPPTGRAGLWGSPYSGTPIRFDDLLITSAH